MMKKNHPAQVAYSDIRATDFTPSHANRQLPKRTPKKHRAFTYIATSGVNGVTENEILFQCRLSSGRNYISQLENKLNIRFERIDEKNPDGIGSHYRYRLQNRRDAEKVTRYINKKAEIGKYYGLSAQQITDILHLYPERHITE